METVITTDPAAAADFINKGKLVAFPTETVFGLGADAFDPVAVASIFDAKQRPPDNPIIVHVGSIDQVSTVASAVPPLARALIERFFPGPITVLVPRSETLPPQITAGSPLVGVRMPSNSLGLTFLRACRHPVAAPSANVSGRPSPTTSAAVFADLNGRIDCILKGEATQFGIESTVVDASGLIPVVLRPGAITLERIVEAVGSGRLASTSEERAASPGSRHPHYSPVASVLLIDSPASLAGQKDQDAYIGLSPLPESSRISVVQICDDLDAYARTMFHFFRECDRLGIQRIWCESVPPHGLGTAIMDRLTRAARH